MAGLRAGLVDAAAVMCRAECLEVLRFSLMQVIFSFDYKFHLLLLKLQQYELPRSYILSFLQSK